jgi:hypothetical protein
LRTAGYISFLASPDRSDAIAKVKRQLSFLLRNKFLRENVASSGIPVDQEAIIAAMSKRDFDTAQRLIPDEAAEAFAVAARFVNVATGCRNMPMPVCANWCCSWPARWTTSATA